MDMLFLIDKAENENLNIPTNQFLCPIKNNRWSRYKDDGGENSLKANVCFVA